MKVLSLLEADMTKRIVLVIWRAIVDLDIESFTLNIGSRRALHT